MKIYKIITLAVICLVVTNNCAYSQTSNKAIYDESAYFAQINMQNQDGLGPSPNPVPQTAIAIIKFRLTNPEDVDKVTIEIGSDKRSSQCSSIRLKIENGEKGF